MALPKPSEIPNNPGVYKWMDKDGRVIYVGKAKNLKQRLTSYFQPPQKLHPRTATMVSTAEFLEWTLVQNELEALTLEHSWINQFEPRFNVIFRDDDKAYSYLAFSQEEFPRVFITRGKRLKRHKFFGPYPQAWAIKSTFEVLQETFQIRNCSKGVFSSAKRSGRPCLLGYIGKCTKPCVGGISESDYAFRISELKRFLKGDVAGVQKDLRQKMSELAQNEEYELAAIKRDQHESIDVVIAKNSVELDSQNNLDVIGTWGDELEVGVHIFHIRRGLIVGENSQIVERGLDQNDGDIIGDILMLLYSETLPSGRGSSSEFTPENDVDIPSEICVSELPTESNALIELLGGLRGSNINLHTVARGPKRDLVTSAKKNAQETLENARKKRTTDLQSRNQAIEELYKYLQLRWLPLRAECYDVSHTQGEFQTGAMVVFEEGLSKKKDYRLFNLRGDFITWGKDGVPDDTAAVYEVIRRRLARFTGTPNKATVGTSADTTSVQNENVDSELAHFAYNPQLLLIDGGLPQVNAAWRAVKDAGMQDQVEVAGIAKRLEEIWRPAELGFDRPVILPRHSLGMYLIQQLRDEAHRFSIVSMRKRRAKKYQKSALDDIVGLGPTRQKLLLKKFGSVKQIKAQSRETLLALPGINEAIVNQLL
jgi:excinuclease ABC subunit C